MKKTALKKADLLLFFAVLVAAAVFFLVLSSSDAGEYAVVTVDGEEVGRYPLAIDTVAAIETESGKNTVVISRGSAYISDADCPDGTCVRSHPISRTGERIICLPHKLMIVIEGGNTDGNDVDLEIH